MSASKHASAGAPTDARQRHDQYQKLYFGHPAAVQDAIVGYIRRFVPNAEAWIDRIDFSTLEPMPTETIDKAYRSRFNDKLWRVRFRDARDGPKWLCIIVMMEFQSSVDWFMALRMQSYAVRIYEYAWAGRRPTSESRLPPILGIVVYSGRTPWRAAQRLSDLVGPGTRPAEPARPEMPTFTGESYVLIDLQRLDPADLPEDNLVSLLALAYGMRDMREVAPIVDKALRVLRGTPRGELYDVFIPWFGMLAKRFGSDLKFLEDRDMIAKQEAEGDVRLLVEDRIQAQIDRIAAQGREEGHEEGRSQGHEEGRAEGLERERSLLRRLVAWRYGTDTAQQVNPLLAATEDPERLTNVGNWIMECATGRDLLERLRNGY